MNETSDEQLVFHYLKGDEKSLEALIRLYLKPIYNFVYRYTGSGQDADDLTQEVFVRVWKNLKKFDRRRSFKTWIFSIAKNASVDFLKKSQSAFGGKKTLPFSQFENEKGGNPIIENIADPAPLPSEILEQKDRANVLTAALAKLSPQSRMVLFLRYNDHFTFREIAESLDRSLNTIKSWHRRALITLKGLLANS